MTLAHTPRQVLLKKKEDRRIRAGHPWVFSNEIQETRGEPAIGDVVQVLDAGGRSLGTGLYNPHSLISVRLVSRLTETLDLDFFRRRLLDALLLRQRILPHAEAFRVVHGESDFLPGLVVDKFNDYLALQTFSYGMDARMGMICDALEQMFSPTGIIERNESPLRQLDGLPERKGVVRGTIAPTTISEHGIRYRVDLLEGQKTGFFLDQRENRQIAGALADGCDVLDCFCNDGGFALNAARGGARSVLGIDVSADAVVRARANATLNSLAGCSFERGDVFERLASLHAEGSTFDMVILDPPSFTRSRKHVQMARKGYRELHAAALSVLRPKGLLLTASCSHHIAPETFLDIVDETCRDAGRPAQLVDWRGAAPDHPVLPEVPETRYLKFGVFRVL